MATEDSLENFRKAWAALPPLVRASIAANHAGHVGQQMDRFVLEILREKSEMPRRAEVSERFLVACAAIRTLMISLANEADDEASAAGIDLDTRYATEPANDAVLEHLLRRQESRDREARARRSPWVPHAELAAEAKEALAGGGDDDDSQ